MGAGRYDPPPFYKPEDLMRVGNFEMEVDGVFYEMRPSTKTAILEILKACPIIVHEEQGDKPERLKSEKRPDAEKPIPPKPEPKKGGMFRRDVS